MPAPLQDFALFTEGVTDQAVLTNILLGFFKDQRQPAINEFFPEYSRTKKYGGWTLLLKELEEGRFQQAFQFSQYVIVEVDTDQADVTGFDVPRNDENGRFSLEAFVVRVTDRLKAAIGEEGLRTYEGRFLFAVAVEQIECWMLPLWFDDATAERTTECFARLMNCPRLRAALVRGQRFEKDHHLYLELSKEYRKRRTLLEKGSRNPSLKIFLDALEARQIMLPPLED